MNCPVVDREVCGYCGACVSVCPASAIELVDLYLRIDRSLCVGCSACERVCPLGAISMSDESGVLHQKSSIQRPESSVHNREYDVLVIGAGPAGSIAARTAAEQNVSVLMIEKRQEIGSPVRCAEGVGKKSLAELTELDPKWISAEINGSRIHAPNGSFIKIDELGAGLVLERKIFDRELSAQAERAGAEIWVKSRAVDLIKENGTFTGAKIRRRDGNYVVKSKVIIAADGVESQVGRWAGIDTTCKPHDVDTCVQYLMNGIDIDPEYCDFYLGKQIAPRGYAWVFPKGTDSANVGIGIGGNIDGEIAVDYLNRFVEKEFLGASVSAMVVGCVPVAGALSSFVRDGLMIVGDAARQNDPMSGGGIINSMIAGQIAGEVAGKSIWNGNVSHRKLVEYEKRWNKQIGRTFRHLRRLREGVLKFSDETFNNIAKILDQVDPRELTLVDIFRTALKNDPKLLLELRHLIRMNWG